MNYAYLRVSTDKQDIENQKLGISEYAEKQSIKNVHYKVDSVSGNVGWRERKIGEIINFAREGDTILVSEISRLGRSTLQVLEIIEVCTIKKLNLHIVKSGITMDGSLHSTIIATVLSLASQIERELVSVRTKEALKKKKESGFKLGRPKGPAKFRKLDEHEEEIDDYMKKDLNVTAISKLVGCSRSTLYYWLKDRDKRLISKNEIKKDGIVLDFFRSTRFNDNSVTKQNFFS